YLFYFVLFFFFIICLLPRFTLFPYTTLFRSMIGNWSMLFLFSIFIAFFYPMYTLYKGNLLSLYKKTLLIALTKLPISLLVLLIRSEEHTSELQSRFDLVCRLLLEKKNTKQQH